MTRTQSEGMGEIGCNLSRGGRRGGERVSGKWAGLGFEISPQNCFDFKVLTSYRGFSYPFET